MRRDDGERSPTLNVARLRKLIGESGAQALMEQFGGQSIPRLSERIRTIEERNRRIREEVGPNCTYREVARRHGLSISHVKRIAASVS